VAALARLVMLVTEGRGLNSRCFGLVTYVEVAPRYVRGRGRLRPSAGALRPLYSLKTLR
jgi:hypothetical protein